MAKSAERVELVPKDESDNASQATNRGDLDNASQATKTSLFGDNEGVITLAWLIFTCLYWTILIWIPTIQNLSFATGGFIAWCFGFIGIISCSYTLYEGKYPSGSTKTDQFETKGIGRYTAAFLTSSVVFDVCVLIWIAMYNDYTINITDGIRLSLHCVHIFWCSLFFYNKFYRFHAHMASRAFFIEWIDIIWSVILSYTLNELLQNNGDEKTAVHYVYFSFISIELCGWMLPMMLLPKWGTQEYAQTVSLHLLILDLVTDIPVIVVVFSYGAYKDNVLLFIDMIWKSFLLIRSISYYLVNQMLYKTKEKEDKEEALSQFDSSSIPQNKFRKISTLLWIIFVFLYWTIFTMSILIMDNEIALKYQYYTWFMGMIGVASVYDTYLAGYYGTTKRGRSMVAFCCTFICTDWILHSFEILYWNEAAWDILVIMAFHAISLLCAILFFYGNALKVGAGDWFNTAWISLFTEWFDILFMYIVIIILYNELGDCLAVGICCGYFVVASIKLYLWFFPIIFGYADTEWRIHAHMLILDTFTDLPLVITIIATEGYNVHWFLFFDISYKIIMLLRCYAYHGVINLILRRVELDQKHKEQLEEAQKDDREQPSDLESEP